MTNQEQKTVDKAFQEVKEKRRRLEAQGITYSMGMRRDKNRKPDGYHEWTT